LSFEKSVPGRRPCNWKGKAKRDIAIARVMSGTGVVKDPTHAETLSEREPGDLQLV
jgi:hypothetical protein